MIDLLFQNSCVVPTCKIKHENEMCDTLLGKLLDLIYIYWL